MIDGMVSRLPAVIKVLNNEVTRLIGKKPVDAIKTSSVTQTHSLRAGHTTGLKEPLLPSNSNVRYLYASSPGEHELEGGRRRSTVPIWSLTVQSIRNVMRHSEQSALNYLLNGPDRGFVREELIVVSDTTELPPDWIVIHR